MQLQLRVSGGQKEKTEGLDPESLHRFAFVFPVPADGSMPVREKVLPYSWRELEIENSEPEPDTKESLQYPCTVKTDLEGANQTISKTEAESNVAVLVRGTIDMAESMGTNLLHRYDILNLNCVNI